MILLKISLGLLVVVGIIFLIYIFGKVGQYIFKQKEWIDGFGILLTMLFLLGLLIWVFYMAGHILLGGLR